MFLIATQEFVGTMMMKIPLKSVIRPKEVYYRETHKHMKNKNKNKTMAGSTYVLFVVYIITSHLTKHSSNFPRIPNHVQNHSYEESN